MIVGFSRHGRGGGAGPTKYLTDAQRAGRENEPPVVLAGDAAQTRSLIDGVEHDWKYTSGVLSFAPGERVTLDQEREIMDRFEKLAFAGLEKSQYDILWVRHTHAGHHELHFVTPRIELESGKSLNIKPPGKRAQQHFDDFRSAINSEFGFSDPDDPARARLVRENSLDLKKAAEALRNGDTPKATVKAAIGQIIQQRADAGLLRSRKELGETLRELGFSIPRHGKDYITIESEGEKHRLKGEIYGKNYDWHRHAASRALGSASEARRTRTAEPDAALADEYKAKVDRHTRARAEYNQKRYGAPAVAANSVENTLAHDHQSARLDDHMRRVLGPSAISVEPNYQQSAANRGARAGARMAEEEGRRDAFQHLRRSPLHQNRPDGPDIPGRVQNNRGVLSDDRARNPVITGIERIIEGARAAASRIGEYLQGEPRAAEAREQLERASNQLSSAAEHHREAVKQQERERSHSHGMAPR